MEVCYIGIGSNLGNRRKTITEAAQQIKGLKHTRIIKLSSLYHTAPIGGPKGQPKFINACLKIITGLSPRSLLNHLQKIEESLGRPKKHLRNSPRTIDLDILFYGDERINTKRLIVPHPRMFERPFVMKPLLEVSP